MQKISPENITTYETDGIVCLRQAFPLEWIDFLRDAVEVAMNDPGPYAEEYAKPGGGRFFGDLELAQRHEAFMQFTLESPAAEIAGRVMGSKRINFFYDQLLVKEPGANERTPWHQDLPYWAVAGRQVCSIWLPLDPVTKETCV
ncbi:MAG: phytanoyl-CoA dioxygenase family protein, partial [Alphaproteobacteria bacterium]|nr:phytanoyl-CoA dioxygenase family protein [Alphaproteobacteria bacterium]